MADSCDLNTRQLRFALGVIEGKPGGKAYVDAGFKAKTSAVADSAASRLLRNVKVAAFIEKMRGNLQQETKVTAERVIQELAGVAFANMADFATWSTLGVTLKASSQMPRELTAVVSEISETPTRYGPSIKMKMHDKMAAIQMLGKHLGIFDVSDRSDKTLMQQMYEAMTEGVPEYDDGNSSES